jgi:DNA-binding NarL/FixJ family response regulator
VRRRTGVVLAAFHPLATAALKRRLDPRLFRVVVRRLEVDRSGQVRPLSIPKATVGVLEVPTELVAPGSAVDALRAAAGHTRLIAVLDELHEAAAFEVLGRGVKGLLDFRKTADQLPRAVREVARGGYWVPRPILSRFVGEILRLPERPVLPRTGHLGAREREIRDLLLANLQNKEIASRLHIAERTVKFHVSNLLAKFGVRRRGDLIVLAHSAGGSAET